MIKSEKIGYLKLFRVFAEAGMAAIWCFSIQSSVLSLVFWPLGLMGFLVMGILFLIMLPIYFFIGLPFVKYLYDRQKGGPYILASSFAVVGGIYGYVLSGLSGGTIMFLYNGITGFLIWLQLYQFRFLDHQA